MNLTYLIQIAEHQFLKILEEFFISVYDERSLSSHGIEHHRKVWGFARVLLSLQSADINHGRKNLAPKLIIASYLHDIGMSVEKGMRHGKHSREFCLQFLRNNRLPEHDYADVLEAVELHDMKEYRGKRKHNELLTILTVADDLDAFGFTGIFRYTEIYHIRGIDPREFGIRIQENAGYRFDFFIKSFGTDAELVRIHQKRYDILIDFFNRYNEQVTAYRFGKNYPSGYCGVVELLLLMIRKKMLLNDFIPEVMRYSNDPLIKWYFNELQYELKQENFPENE